MQKWNNLYTYITHIHNTGFADKNRVLPDAVTHDKLKKKVTLEPIEGSDDLIKEFQICDVILSNHQNLARIKADCARLQNRVKLNKPLLPTTPT